MDEDFLGKAFVIWLVAFIATGTISEAFKNRHPKDYGGVGAAFIMSVIIGLVGATLWKTP